MRKTLLILALSLSLMLSACSAGAPAEDGAQTPETTAEVTPEAPAEATPETSPETSPEEKASFANFTATDLDGNEADESIFADYDLTMINIWATFCGPCLGEMPELGELAKEYQDKGVRIVGIVADVQMNSDGSLDADMVALARELVTETGADYLHLLPSADLYAAKLNSVNAVPETIFVDSEGNLVGESYVGSKSGSDWAAIIDALLPEARG